MAAGAATKTFVQRWVKVEAFPIIGCVVVATSGFVGLIGRAIFSDPDITVNKDKRTNGYFPAVSEGEAHFNHFIRQQSHKNTIGVFPNQMMSEPATR